MGVLLFDLRDALRGFRRDRAYAVIVVLTVALTVGAATAVFSIVDGVLLTPLAYRESHRLVALAEFWRQFPRSPWLPINERHFEYWRTHAKSFESLAQYISRSANLTGAGEAAQITVVHASGSLFDVLQVAPALGRTLTPADEPSGRPDVTVITDRLWRERYGADPRIVGRTAVLDGRPYTIVGVLPPGFRLPDVGRLDATIDAFIAIRMDAEQVPWFGEHNNSAVARLKPGVTLDEARAELDVLQAQISRLASDEAHEPIALSGRIEPLAETIVGTARRGLLLLLAAIMAVLLIACSNLANLSLTRALARVRDASIRAALGASRIRLAVRAVVEQMLLAGAGGALGLLVAWTALKVFVRTAPIDLPRASDVALNARVLVFAAAATLATGAVVAVLPALRFGGRDVQTSLRAGGLATTSDRGGMRTRAALLAVQVALSVALLVVTGLLTVSFLRLLNVDRGFDADNVLAMRVALPASRYADDSEKRAVFDRVLDAVKVLPGVVAASPTSMTPLGGEGQVNFIVPDGSTVPRSKNPSANFRFVGPAFFRAMGIVILRGRAFTDADRATDRPAPVLISEDVGPRMWPGEDPLGKRFSRGIPGEPAFEVVGIVADARTTSLERPSPLMVYAPFWWGFVRTSATLLIRTAGDPAAIASSVRRAVHGVDVDIAVGEARPLGAIVDASMSGRRYQTELFTAFGAMALFIAALGIYAVTSYSVSRRRREMNIRVALGAPPAAALALVIRQAAAPVLAGLAAGAIAAMLAGQVAAALLFDVSARDPSVIGAVVAIVGGVGLGACVTAARRGLSIDPAAALRDE